MVATLLTVLRSSFSSVVTLSCGNWGGRNTEVTDDVPDCDKFVLRLGCASDGWLRLMAPGIPWYPCGGCVMWNLWCSRGIRFEFVLGVENCCCWCSVVVGGDGCVRVGCVPVVENELDVLWLAGVILEVVVPCPDVVESSMESDSMGDVGSFRSIVMEGGFCCSCCFRCLLSRFSMG